MTEDLFTAAKRTNVPEMSVSELAFSLKRTLEETYGRVRVRGELTGLKLASSGHLYGDIKDVDSVINIVCWKGTMGKLSIRPEDGLDVIVTGKVTSYPKNSRYQLVVESMELAGEGALLKMLEERRKKLAAEGLFDESRKKDIPFLPDIIGVVTSPTGAVIRDIIHRVSERFPRHILVWPVAVQGEAAAGQITAAIRGFNAMKENRPDLIIVARGGGSLEDLMAFNEENVVRAAAESSIPLISAVGHETDTTLIDYASDLRAPTPTGAAERAVPVRLNLLAQVMDDSKRLASSIVRRVRELGSNLDTLRAKLGDPSRLMDIKMQHLDTLSSKLLHGFEKGLSAKNHRLAPLVPRHPRSLIEEKFRHIGLVGDALQRTGDALLKDPKKHLDHTVRMLESLSFERVLDRGYAVVRSVDGRVISDRADAANEPALEIEFRGKQRIRVAKS